MINTILIVSTCIMCVIGLLVAVWSLIGGGNNEKTCTTCKHEPEWKEAYYHHPDVFNVGVCKKTNIDISESDLYKTDKDVVYVENGDRLATFEDCNLWEAKDE